MTEATDIEPTCCPYCATIVDAAVASEPGRHKPKPGMFVVCMNCGALLRFAEGLALEKCDVHKVPNIPPAVLEKVRAVQQILKEVEKKEVQRVQREMGRKARR